MISILHNFISQSAKFLLLSSNHLSGTCLKMPINRFKHAVLLQFYWVTMLVLWWSCGSSDRSITESFWKVLELISWIFSKECWLIKFIWIILYLHKIGTYQIAKIKQGFLILADTFKGWPATKSDIFGFTWQFKNIAVFGGMTSHNSLKLLSN